MIKNIVILALLGLFAWQHEQDTQDRQEILGFLNRSGSHVHVAYQPCAKPEPMHNYDKSKEETPLLPDPKNEQID